MAKNKSTDLPTTYHTGYTLKDAWEVIQSGQTVNLTFEGEVWASLVAGKSKVEVTVYPPYEQAGDDFEDLVPDSLVTLWDEDNDGAWTAQFNYANVKPAKKVASKAAKPAPKKVPRKVSRTIISKKVNGKVVKPSGPTKVALSSLRPGGFFTYYGKDYTVKTRTRSGEVMVTGPGGITSYPNDTKVWVYA